MKAALAASEGRERVRPYKVGSEVTVIISSHLRETVFAIMFCGLLVSKTAMTTQLILSEF